MSKRITSLTLSLAVFITALIVGGGAWTKPAAGLPDEGVVVGWLTPLFSFISVVLGLFVLGLLTVAVFIGTNNNPHLDDQGVEKFKTVVKLAGLWSMVELSSSVLTLATVLGMKFSEVFAPGVIGTYLLSLPPARYHVFAALLAFAIAVIATFARSLNSGALVWGMAALSIVLPLLSSHSAAMGDHSLALTSSILHGLAMSLWVGTLFAVLPHVNSDSNLLTRYSALATFCVAILVVSGFAAAYTRLDSPSDLIATSYGRFVVLKVLLLISCIAVASRIRGLLTSATAARAKLLATEITLMFIAIGLGTALHQTPFSRTAVKFPSAGEDLLGFVFPQAPTAAGLIFGWHPEWMMLFIAFILGALYTNGIVRLRRRGDSWSVLASVSFYIGLAIITWATSSGVSRYAMVSVSSHMLQHMGLSMLAPIFLVLGKPVTLALRALPATTDPHHRGAREWINALLHSTYAKFITHPLIVLVIFTFGLYGIYFTPAFADLMSGHIGHLFMEIHFLITGSLFSYVIIGTDPSPRKVPHGLRLFLVLIAMSLHAFFAVALMQTTIPIGYEWYAQVRPPWIQNPLDDSYAGGGVAWAFGELPTLILMIGVAIQWSQSETRLAKRLDRKADLDGNAELNAYNERLAKLNQYGQSVNE